MNECAFVFDTPLIEGVIQDLDKSWIGINQNAVNRYVEYFLKNDGFKDMIGMENEVFREQKLGISKSDFLFGNTNL